MAQHVDPLEDLSDSTNALAAIEDLLCTTPHGANLHLLSASNLGSLLRLIRQEQTKQIERLFNERRAEVRK